MLHIVYTSISSCPNDEPATTLCGKEVQFTVIENPKGKMKKCLTCENIFREQKRRLKGSFFIVHRCEANDGDDTIIYKSHGLYWTDHICKYCGNSFTINVPNPDA